MKPIQVKQIILNIVFMICFILTAFGQNKDITITGKVIESINNQPVAFATVLIKDSVTKKNLSGTTTIDDGTFRLKTEAANFYIEISFIGFKTKTIAHFKSVKDKIDLGKIIIEEDLAQLDAVVVEAEISKTEFKLDKRIFNIGKDLSSTGASALEVLNNVPSVNVGIEGNITLRGSQGVQILINGKPSVLASDSGNALGTITADMMERVEVITNPSAKYDAEGTSGIINIVLKKDQKKGLNGSISLNTGKPDTHSVGISINRRTEKLNIFSQIGLGRRSFPNEYNTVNRNLQTGESIINNGNSEMHEKFYNILLGSDFLLNKLNVLTISGSYAFEKEDTPGLNQYNRTDNNNNVIDSWERQNMTYADNPKWQYELQYKKDFEDNEDHVLLFSALGSSFIKDSEANFKDTVSFGNGQTNSEEQNLTNYGRIEYTFKLDYTRPFSEYYTLETGAQYYIQDVFNDYEVLNLTGDIWVSDPLLTNVFNYTQNVLGVYATTSYEGDKWGLKLGARLENTDINTLLENTNEQRTQNYTNLFPSIHTSYKLTSGLSFQAGYSKRIRRPGMRDLNPFNARRDNFNISAGNPDLQPEFTDSYEVTSIFKFNKLSLNFGIYHRYTTDVIEQVFTYENDISTRMPINIGTNNTTGIEFNGKYTPAKWVAISGDANFNFFKRRGTFEGAIFDFNGDLWSAKLNSKFNLPADFDFEITGNYRSPFQGVLRHNSKEVFADAGLRKKIIKGKVILNLSVRDVFASRKYISTTNQPNYYLSSERFRGRFVTLGLSYGFGKGEAMEFSGQRRRH